MSQALRGTNIFGVQGVVAKGHQAVTMTAGETVNQVSVTLAQIQKATDTILVTLDQNAETDVVVGAPTFVFAVTDAAGFTVRTDLENAGGVDATVFINWAVIR
tara:strand:+ start:898 stop:1206 length:309 start_codon:yes stop_codon:yes gene_type:complete